MFIVCVVFNKLYSKEIYYLTTCSTHFIYSYVVSDLIKNHSDTDRKPTAAATWATLQLIARDLLYAVSQDSTYHSL